MASSSSAPATDPDKPKKPELTISTSVGPTKAIASPLSGYARDTTPATPSCTKRLHTQVTSPTSPFSPVGRAVNNDAIPNDDPNVLERWRSADSIRRMHEVSETNMVGEADLAEFYFRDGAYAECRNWCHQIFIEEPPSEAIRARAHMYLACEELEEPLQLRL